MNNIEFKKWLEKISDYEFCHEADTIFAWLGKKTIYQAWRSCNRVDLMAFVLTSLPFPRPKKRMVIIFCKNAKYFVDNAVSVTMEEMSTNRCKWLREQIVWGDIKKALKKIKT